MLILLILTVFSLLFSLLFDVQKTIAGVKSGLDMLCKIMPPLITVIIIVSVLLFLIPKEMILKYLGNESGLMGYIFAAVIGAVTLIPGFIAYPLCGFLVKNGVSYPIIAVFVTTLMMVGIVTIPIEKKYFGIKVTLLRNGLSFMGALVVGILIGLLWCL
jgi:uncharacterized membrane protein YraQ (UPF0718 family)